MVGPIREGAFIHSRFKATGYQIGVEPFVSERG
ncbi:MAG: hypothetical protein M2R45_03880 [Verrucomicrobia subdivision 3 bacterium]|nr:hypothetical protein [Limisphaerales bacterium]MCS1412584.1 hypothetical protein [Limisphaerales bacterium]